MSVKKEVVLIFVKILLLLGHFESAQKVPWTPKLTFTYIDMVRR